MRGFGRYSLDILRKVYGTLILKRKCFAEPQGILDADVASQMIVDLLVNDRPCMIARFGSTELSCLSNYNSVKHVRGDILGYINGTIDPWWWNFRVIHQMEKCAGFFPGKIDQIEEFCELMLRDIPLIDLLGSWLPQEQIFTPHLKKSDLINIELLMPFFSSSPWTSALKGKKVLVVHPFARTIERQYKIREFIFQNDLLPEFHLETITAVQSIAGEPTIFESWFEALEYMKDEIDKRDFDICLIGCGAYGLPLAAHVKRIGKKAMHLGGSLQLLFGIRGKRWENEKYNEKFQYFKLINEHWVKPGIEETPARANQVEGACYW